MEVYNGNVEEFFRNNGMEFYNKGQFNQALMQFERGLEFHSDDEKLLYMKAVCLMHLNHREAANTIFKKVIEICSSMEKTEEILNLQSNSYMYLCEYSKAQEIVDKLLEINPNNIQALLSMLSCLQRTYKYEEALEYADRILDIDPSNFDATLLKSDLLISLERYDEAKEYLDEAYEMNPDFGHVWYIKGQIESKDSNYEEAVKCYKKAIELEPASTAYLYDLGINLLLLGKKDEAKHYLKNILDLSPDVYEPERYELLDEVTEIMGSYFASKRGN